MSRVIGRLVVLLAVVLMLLWGGVEILRAGLVAERWGVVAEGEERAVATVISGTINSPMTWSVANSPYLLQGWVTIAPGVTVTVEPGVTVQGALDSVLFVDGHLASVGTAGQPILFTSEANTAPGEWIGLVVNGSAELDWTTLRYGNGTPLMAWPSDPNDQVIVRNSIIEETLGYGLHTRADKWHQVVMSNVQFVNNQLDAVLVQTFSGGDYYQPQESLHLEAMPGLLGYEMEGGSLVVSQGMTLTVDAGLALWMPASSSLDVLGHLDVRGTFEAPNFIGPLGAGNWYGVNFSGSGVLDYAYIFGAGEGGQPAMWVGPNDPTDMVVLNNSWLDLNDAATIRTRADKVHQLQMNNVSFVDNGSNVVEIETYDGFEYFALADSVTLTPQPGLEGYVIKEQMLMVSPGMTLTLAAGTQLMGNSGTGLDVLGHLAVMGTVTQPVTMTSRLNSGPGEWIGINFSGSGEINYGTIRSAGEGGFPAMWVGPNDPTDMVLFNHSRIENNGGAALETRANKLHQLLLSDTEFGNNGQDVVLIETYDGFEYFALADSVTLTPQPGLEGYVIKEQMLMVSPGMTLTLAAGTQLMGNSGTSLEVLGHLAVMGTASQPVTMTSRLNSGPGEWYGVNFSGSGEVNYGVIRYAGQNSLPAVWVGPNDPTDMVLFNDSRIESNGGVAMETRADKLHRLQMNNTEFRNNSQNQVVIETYDGFEYFALADSATLTPQPGLEGYLIEQQALMVSPGMTLTLAAGTQLMGNSGTSLEVLGHLAVMGTASQPVTMTSGLNSGPGEWYGVYFSGSGEVNYGVIRYAGQNSLPAVWVGPNDPTDMVLFNDSRIESNGGVAMETRADKLHQLQMNNVMFSGNSGDVVEIRTFDGFEYFALADSVTLRPQPGLRGYLIESDGLQVPQGMTLTLAAGTQLMGNSGTYVGVLGHLASMGTASQPVTMTSVLDTAGGEWIGLIVYGSAYLEQTRLRYGDGASLMAWPNDPNDEVVLLDSIIEGTSGYPIHTRADKWHQLGLTGTQFISNSWPMIGVETHDGSIGYTPQASLDLVQYPGLFGYEMLGGGLVIEPGVVITMAGNQSLLVPAGEQIEVGGKLAIQATWGEEVILSGVGGTFEGVRVVSGGVIDWYHVDINGAGQTTGWGLLVESGGEAYLSTSRINNGAGDGLVVAGGVVDMECGQLMGNNGNGVTVTGDVGSVLRMAGVDVVGNTGWGVENLNTEGVWAVYNWWGAASGPSGVGPGTGSSITGTVMYEPWLSAAGCMDWVDLAAAAAGPADVFINEPLTHTLRMMHQGGIEASGLVLMAEVTGGDLLGMSIEPAGSCAYSGLGFTCTVASLLAGQESVVTVMISPTLGGVVTSTVGVFSTVNGDMVMGNNEAVVTTTVRLPLVAERPVGTAVTLRWGAEPRACLYEIHRGETPYFELTGVTAIDKVAALEYTDVAGAGDVGVNYYYKVVAVDCSLEPVGETLRVGVFDFGVVEGS